MAPVGDLSLKAAAALGDGAKTFVFPAAQAAQLSFGVPLDTLRSAALLWLGAEGLERGLAETAAAEYVLPLIDEFLAGNAGPHYPIGSGGIVREAFQARSTIADAYWSVRSEWLALVLSRAHLVPEEAFPDLLELADPRFSAEESTGDPGRMEELLSSGIRDLSRRPREVALQSVLSAAALIRLAGAMSDLSALMRLPSILNALSGLAEVVQETASSDPEVIAAFRQIQNLYQAATRIAGGQIASPHQFDAAPLKILPVYQEGVLAALEFVTAQEGVEVVGTLPQPVALFDCSRALPRSWQRRDWRPGDSLLDRLPNGPEVLGAFGNHTGFLIRHPTEEGRPDLSLLWGDGTGTWPPSIDTLHLLGHLARAGFYDGTRRHGHVLDLGCGTGVHGLAVAKWSRVQRLDLLDSELGARLTATTNVLTNFETFDRPRPVPFMSGAEVLQTAECRVRFLNHDAPHWLRSVDQPYDLTICTPPYVPYLDTLRTPHMWQAVAGTDLLRFVLGNWREFTNTLVIQFSEMALGEVGDVLPEDPPFATELVGFRIPPLARFFDSGSSALDARGVHWRDRVGHHLLDSSQEQTLAERHHGFRYFHRLRTYILRR